MGYSLNDSNPVHIKQAEQDLQSLTPQVRGVVGDEITMMLQQNEGHIVVVWSGVAAPLVQEGDTYDYVVPKEGSNVWFDNMVIPKTAQNKEGAYQFINFLLDAKNNKQKYRMGWVCYSNKAARNLLPNNIKMITVFIQLQKNKTIRSL